MIVLAADGLEPLEERATAQDVGGLAWRALRTDRACVGCERARLQGRCRVEWDYRHESCKFEQT